MENNALPCAPNTKGKRILELDFMKCVFIILVVTFHLVYIEGMKQQQKKMEKMEEAITKKKEKTEEAITKKEEKTEEAITISERKRTARVTKCEHSARRRKKSVIDFHRKAKKLFERSEFFFADEKQLHSRLSQDVRRSLWFPFLSRQREMESPCGEQSEPYSNKLFPLLITQDG